MIRSHALSMALALVVLSLAGCGGDGNGEPPPPATAAPETAAPEPAGIPLVFTATGEVEVTGTGRVLDEGESTLVTIELSGLPGAGSYNAHIHNGTCAEIGGVAVRLTAVTAGEDGRGTSTTTFATADLPEGPLVVQVHGADGPGIACAEIHRH